MTSTFERVTCPGPLVSDYSTANFLIAASLFIIPRWIFSIRAIRGACLTTRDSTTTHITQEARAATFSILVHFICAIVISLTFFEYVVIVGGIPSHPWVVCAWFLHQLMFGIIVSVQRTQYQIAVGFVDVIMMCSLIWSSYIECGPTRGESLVVGCGGLFELFLISVIGWRVG